MAMSQVKQFSNQRTLAPSLFDIPETLHQSSTKEDILHIETPAFKKMDTQHYVSIENALNTIFVDSIVESKLQRARRILGDISLEISDEELIRCFAEFQHLVDSWLDEFEMQILDNKTLNQVLKEGQNGTICR
jgi:hypothetical protein